MGKKTKKTKWRTLEISLPMPGKHYRENGTSSHLQWDDGWRASSNKYRPRGGGGGGSCDNVVKTSARLNVCAQNSSSEENQHAKTLDEDEYTKITTPRQDVLFKKSYLTKRKALLHAGAGASAAENVVDNLCTDGAAMVSVGVSNYGQEFCDYATVTTDGGCGSGVDGGDISSLSRPHPQLVCATSQPYMDASSAAAAIYYGGGYEIYDPYTGNVTAVVVGGASSGPGAAATCQPILTSLPCRPVPLQSLQWFNPVPSTSEWCGGGGDDDDDDDGTYTQQDDVRACVAVAVAGADAGASKASYSSDSANVSEPASESSSSSSCTTESTTRTTGGDDNVYASPQSYVYPGYVLGTPVYNLADDNGNLGYCSPVSPILSGNESTTTKRKKKRKRRRRFGEAEEDSESGVEEYRQDADSRSGNEYVVFDYTYDPIAGCGSPHVDNSAVNGSQLQRSELRDLQTPLEDELDHDHDHHRHQHHHHRRRRHRTSSSTLSHASINAPPFVPAKHAFVDVTQIRPYPNRLPECVLSVSDRCNGYDKPCPTEKYMAATPSSNAAAAAAAAATCAPSGDNRNDSPLSSGNSDSGIGSPANEDCVSTDGRDFAKIAKAPAAVGADRSTNADVDGVAPAVPDIGRGTCLSVSVVAYAPDAGNARNSSPIGVNADRGCQDATIRADGRDQESKKPRMKDTPRSNRRHSKNEESSVEPDATAAESTITNENRLGRCDGKAEDDGGGEMNRKKRSNKSTKIANRSQIAPTTVGVENATDCSGGCVDDGRNGTSDGAPFEYEVGGGIKSTGGDVVVENDSLHAASPAPPPPPSSSDEPISTGRVVENENSRRDDGILINRTANVVIEEKCSSVESSRTLLHGRPYRFDRDQPTVDQEKTLLAKFHDVNDSASSSSSSSSETEAVVKVEAKSDDSLESVVLVARTIVDEIVQQAALRIRTSSRSTTTEKCDKLRLPLTQAVTTWMNESGGLPAVVVRRSSDHRRPFSTSSVELEDSPDSRPTRSKTTKSVESLNCVIC